LRKDGPNNWLVYFGGMSEPPRYSYRDETDAMGFAPAFKGPGLSRYASHVHVMQPMNEWATQHADASMARHEAERIVWLLDEAFEAGRRAAFAELRALIRTGE
jgi:hypothetical protein